jgi:hypothetical protein
MTKIGRAARIAADMIRDAAGLGSIASISYGAWLVYQPAGFIVGGALVLIVVLASSFGQPRAVAAKDNG